MKAASLIRTGSGPVQSQLVPGSPKLSLSRRNSSGDKAVPNSPRISLHLDRKLAKTTIRRALSDSDVFRSPSRLSSVGSLKLPAIIPEEEYLSDADEDTSFETVNRAGFWPEIGIPVDEFGHSGGGFGKGRKFGDGGRDGNADRSKIGDYYQEMLKSNPGDPLLLRNYGKYLHEVEKDTVRAEEYYGRAILASPGDGELLSLYVREADLGDAERRRQSQSLFRSSGSRFSKRLLGVGIVRSFYVGSRGRRRRRDECACVTVADGGCVL